MIASGLICTRHNMFHQRDPVHRAQSLTQQYGHSTSHQAAMNMLEQKVTAPNTRGTNSTLLLARLMWCLDFKRKI